VNSSLLWSYCHDYLPQLCRMLAAAARLLVAFAGKKKAAASSDDAETGFVRQVVNLHDKYLEVRVACQLLSVCCCYLAGSSE
jgi:hypothetical protein